MITYKSGYKYQLTKTYIRYIDILDIDCGNDFVKLDKHGRLTICEGYAWDGPSGPTIDTPSFMQGSLVHDAIYQLMRECGLSKDFRLVADQTLHNMCLNDGMSRLRAQYVYWAVRIFGEKTLERQNPERTAP